MEQFKKGMLSDGDASESLAAAESAFVREAGASVPSKTSCTFTWALQLTQRLSDPYQLPPQLVDEVESERLALKGRVEGLALLRIPTLRIPTCPSPPCAGAFKLERASLVGAMQAILIEQKKAQQVG